MRADTRAEEMDKRRQQLKVVVQRVSENIAQKNKEMKKSREPLQEIVQFIVQSIENKGTTQMVEENIDENYNTIKNTTCDGSKSICQKTAATRNEEMKKRREQLRGIVQNVTKNIVQKKGVPQIAEQNGIGSIRIEEMSAESKSNTTNNMVATPIEEHIRATRKEEMKMRRGQLQGIIQKVTKDIAEKKGASQISEQDSVGSIRIEELNGDSKINTIKNMVATPIQEHTSATRNDEMKKRREQLRGIVQNVTKDIVQNKGASQIAEDNGDDSTNVDSGSSTPESFVSTQVEEMNGDSECDMIKSILEAPIEETRRKREELPVLVQKVSEDFVQNNRSIDPKDIIREGFLLKQSKFLKQWRKRWFVLTSSCLYAFKKESDKTNPTEFIYLDECSCVRVLPHRAGQNNVIVIDTPDRTLLLSAPSATERDAWTDSLNNRCILSMVVGGRLGRRLSRFVIAEGDESCCEIEDDRDIEP